MWLWNFHYMGANVGFSNGNGWKSIVPEMSLLIDGNG